MKKKIVTKEMVANRISLIISTLMFEHETCEAGHLEKIRLARSLLIKLSENKVPPAIILVQLIKHFGNIKFKRIVSNQLSSEIKERITNKAFLN